MAELITKQLQTLQFNSEVATAADVSSFVNTTATELSSSLIARIQALEGFSTFIGVKDALPESAENGQIVIVGEKEYIWGPKADGVAGWTELGDTTAEAAAIDELSSAIADLATTKADVSAVNASVEALTKAIDDVEASLSGYDTVGSADAALTSAKAYTDEQVSALSVDVYGSLKSVALKTEVEAISATLSTFGDIVTHDASEFDQVGSAAAAQEAAISAAKAYTDEQIAAVEGEISSLTDVVETKADQTAVDAAISAINDSISALSTKAEEDPVFTAWKENYDGIIAGYQAEADGSNLVAIGSYVKASIDSVAIGTFAETASGGSSVALGKNTKAASGAVAIGTNAKTEATNYGVAIGSDSSTEDGVALGYYTKARTGIAIGKNANSSEGYESIALGNNAVSKNYKSVQIGEGTNDVDGSLQFCDTQIVDGNGKITTANLAGIDTLKTAVSAIEEVTAEDNVQALREAVNTLVAAIKTFVGA